MPDAMTTYSAEHPGHSVLASSSPHSGMPTTPLLSIEFGRKGNAAPYQVKGWSGPEDGYTFTVGAAATLALPVTACENGMILELRLHPFAFRDVLPSQRLCLRVNGVPIGSTLVKQRTTVAFLIPMPVARSTLELQIEQPNATKPSDIMTSKDHRRLGVAVYRLRLYRLEQPLSGPRFAAMRTILNREADLPGALEDLEAQIGMPAERLVTTFESLGDNCEFGMLQRKCGAEPLGLFRFSSVPLSPLLLGLENGFEGLGDPETILPRLEDKPVEWMIHESRYLLRYHSGKKEHEATEEEMRQREAKKLKFLRGKMLEDLAEPTKIFVYKRQQALTFEEVLPLFRGLNTYGPASLLWVVPATGTYPPGTVEVILPGLYRGHIDKIPPHNWPGDLSIIGWLEVCASAYLLSQSSSGVATAG